MTHETEHPPAKRLPYGKPVLRSVSLAADQVLGVGCKGYSDAASGYESCIIGNCYGEGS